jgi:DNA-binding NtrC family response regulator
VLLLVDDDDEFRALLARRFGRRGHEVAHTGSPAEALAWAQRRHFDVAIVDVSMPEMDGVTLLGKLKDAAPETQVIMLTGQGTLETAVRAMKLGAYDYLTKPCDLAELELHVQRAAERGRLARENRNLKAVMQRAQAPEPGLVGQAPALQQALRLIDRVAPTHSPVLIQGESGTGKELAARRLHQRSLRRDQPLVVVNCAALQEPLLESELFGHEKGAFTTAVASKPGLFEVAHGGTLFIDEVGELAPGLQAKLLRVLEDGRIRRVGSVKEVKTDVRVIAATNRDLATEVEARRFRDDLYYRLNVLTVVMPPLRDRREDIPQLVEHFLTQGDGGPVKIERAALEALMAYSWPGNVRELANVITRARILADGAAISTADLPPHILATASRPTPGASPHVAEPAAPRRLIEQERDALLAALAQEHGNKAQAARTLGISRRKLYRLLAKHGLPTS